MAKLGDECDYSSSSEEDNLDPRIQVKFPVLFNYLLFGKVRIWGFARDTLFLKQN